MSGLERSRKESRTWLTKKGHNAKMKEVKHYICDICGTEYSDKDSASICEKGHKKPITIIRSRYLPLKQNALGLPTTVVIGFDDGSRFEYKRG